MAKQKLTAVDVLLIKKELRETNNTHQTIANKYGVSREAITKIKKSITTPHHPDARWNDLVGVEFEDTLPDVIMSEYMMKMFIVLDDDKAGALIKSICRTKLIYNAL
jgi:hypothetical protein